MITNLELSSYENKFGTNKYGKVLSIDKLHWLTTVSLSILNAFTIDFSTTQ